MSVLCHGQTHVYTVGSLRCQCGAAANTPPGVSKGHGYPFPAGYNPFGLPRPPTPPTAGQGPPVNIAQFEAAQRSGGSHLSADGERVYCVRYGQTLEAGWNNRTREYGAWGPVAEMPKDAVAM